MDYKNNKIFIKEKKMIFDTHAHYDDEAFNEDREQIISTLQQNGIKYVVNVSADMQGSRNNLEIINKVNYFFGSVGVHPSDTQELDDEKIKELKDLAQHKKIVAIGEIGLDYYWDEPDRDIQKKWFIKQIELAKEIKKPIIVHSRDAAKDTIDIIRETEAHKLGGVIHCFSYGVEMAKQYVDMGFYIGVGGVLTFKNAKKLKEVVEYVPLEKIVLETDCPYLAPVPFRGKRNDSTMLKYVVDEVAAIKNITPEEVEEITMHNACKMYKLNLN